MRFVIDHAIKSMEFAGLAFLILWVRGSEILSLPFEVVRKWKYKTAQKG